MARSRSPDRDRKSRYRSPSPSGSASRYDRSRDKRSDDRDRDRDSDRDRDRRDRDKDRHADRDRDHDRDRRSGRDDRDRYRHRSRERDTDRDGKRTRDVSRDRYRDKSRERERDRDRSRDRRDRDRRDRDRYDDRYRDRSRERSTRDRSRDRERDRRPRDGSRPLSNRGSSRSPGPASTMSAPLRMGFSDSPAPPPSGGSPAPGANLSAEEEKQRQKRERLEAWKKKKELEKKAKSSTPEPSLLDKKPDVAKLGSSLSHTPLSHTATVPPPSTSTTSNAPKLQMGAIKKISLAGASNNAHTKRSFADMDDEDAPERKLVKIEMDELPPLNPEVQSGAVAGETLGDDLAAEDVPQAADGDVDMDGSGATNGAGPAAAAKAGDGSDVRVRPQDRMEIDTPATNDVAEEDEEDELDAYMRSLNAEAGLPLPDSKKPTGGLAGIDADSDDEPEPEVKAGPDDIATKEATLAEAAAKTRKKDLPPPDHSKIDYEPFRKNFYTAPLEVLDMTEKETELLRLEMDGIKIRGLDAPKPVRNWGSLGLPLACLDVIQANGWKNPTSIQAQAIPAIMSGRDVIGIAKTGSGKTVAFMLPLLRHVKDQRPATGAEGPIAVVCSPTRELAMQIYREAKAFVKAMSIKVACCVGGSSISEDIANMKRGADIVVCTPGRMIDLLTANNGRVTNLRRCTYLVLDEADRMFDMGFEPQVMKIYNNIRPDAQKVLFSATFPKLMEGLARKLLVRPLEITVGGRSVVAPEIDQRVEVRDNDTKFNRLLEILGEANNNTPEGEDFRALIFVDRQEYADDLFRDLLQRGYVCSSLHGGKEQVDRDEAIKNFKAGDVPIMVATSVAARGLDVLSLKMVINYDAPNHLEDYVHRAGRTGRAGNKGTAITFITPQQDRYAVDIMRALEASNAFISDELKALAEGFLKKIKAGEARANKSGFQGKGLERLQKKRDDKDRAEKSTYGDTSEALSLASREGAVIPYRPKDRDLHPKGSEGGGRDMRHEVDYTFTEIKVEIVNGPAPDRLIDPALFRGAESLAKLPQQAQLAIEKAKKEGRMLDAQRLTRVVAQLHTSLSHSKGAGGDGVTLAPEALAALKSKDPDATDYHAIFPINDYPQKARWKATNKEQMTLLAELSGASVTMRGIYYPPGEEPKVGGEPKLHLLIESNDRDKVVTAVDEVRRNIVDASMMALNTADRGGAMGGRYAM